MHTYAGEIKRMLVLVQVPKLTSLDSTGLPVHETHSPFMHASRSHSLLQALAWMTPSCMLQQTLLCYICSAGAYIMHTTMAHTPHLHSNCTIASMSKMPVLQQVRPTGSMGAPLGPLPAPCIELQPWLHAVCLSSVITHVTQHHPVHFWLPPELWRPLQRP